MSKRQGGDLEGQGANGAKVAKSEVVSNGLQQVRGAEGSISTRPSEFHCYLDLACRF